MADGLEGGSTSGEMSAGHDDGTLQEDNRDKGWGNDGRTQEDGQNNGWHQDDSSQKGSQDNGWGNSPDPNTSADDNTYDQQSSPNREGRGGNGWDQTSPVFFRGWGKRDPDASEQTYEQNVKFSQEGEEQSQGWPDATSSEAGTSKPSTERKSSHDNGGWGSTDGWGKAPEETSRYGTWNLEKFIPFSRRSRNDKLTRHNSETDTVQPESSARQTWDASSSNQHSANPESTIKEDSLQYLEQWGGLGGFMNAFMIDPARADAVYQAGRLILVLRAQKATFAWPRKQPWDEEMAEGIARWAM
ncbi:hypothetical protein B0T20DRAFT_423555 [Sordaria brevicollis]|uniref:Uncharacterized protein n=1 Tax=Sordaria brevicollis TaxID=83679 RepID=A0AAE0P182_SORBR|nr:hypothetical protein B0T20DRAFT_423555 [Sordaria brevicollis]